MKNVKRFIALVLVLSMGIAALATIGAATDPKAEWDARQAKAVSKLEQWDIDVIGNKAETTISRETFVYWMSEVTTHLFKEEGWKLKPEDVELPYTDVVAGQNFYAAVANSYDNGWIVPGEDATETSFRPEDPITLGELSKIIVRAMGYDQNIIPGNDWKYQYLMVANQVCCAFSTVHLAYKGAYNPDRNVTYGEAAEIIYTISNEGKSTRECATEGITPILTSIGINYADWFVVNQGSIGTITYQGVVEKVAKKNDTTKTVKFWVLDGQEYVAVTFDLPNAQANPLATGYGVVIGFGLLAGGETNFDELKSVQPCTNTVVDTFYVAKDSTNKDASKRNYTMSLPSSYTSDRYFTVGDKGVTIGGATIAKVYASVAALVAGESVAAKDALKDTAHGASKFVATDVDGDGKYDRVILLAVSQAFKQYEVVIGKQVKVDTKLTANSYTTGSDKNALTVVIPGATGNGSIVAGYATNAALPAFFVKELTSVEYKVGYIKTATTVDVDGQYTVEIVPAGQTEAVTLYMPTNAGKAGDYKVTENVTVGNATLQVVLNPTTQEGYEFQYPIFSPEEGTEAYKSLNAIGISPTGLAEGTADYAKVAAWMVNKYVKYATKGSYVVYATTTMSDPTDKGLVLDVTGTPDAGENTFDITVGVLGGENAAFEKGGVTKVVTRSVRGAASSLEDWENYAHYNRIYTTQNLQHGLSSLDKLEGYNLTYGQFISDAGTLYIFRYVPTEVDVDLTQQPDYQQDVFEPLTSKFFLVENEPIAGTKHVLDKTKDKTAEEALRDFIESLDDDTLESVEALQEFAFEGWEDGADQRYLTDDDYDKHIFIQQYRTQYAENPYYELDPVYNNKGQVTGYQFVRYWTTVTTGTVWGISIPQPGEPIETYLAVYHEDHTQVQATTEAEVIAWEETTVDASGVAAKYVVKMGYVYRVNTTTPKYKVVNGAFVYDTYYSPEDGADTQAERDVKVVVYEDMLKSNAVKVSTRGKNDVLDQTVKPVDYIPNDLVVEVDGKKYAADENTTVIIMSPEFDTTKTTAQAKVLGGEEYTLAELVEGNYGVWATRKAVTFTKLGKTDTYYANKITVIGELFDLGWVRPEDPDQPPVIVPEPVDPRKTVYLANGETVVEQEETGLYYVVRSKYAAVDIATGETVGSIAIPYSTYIDAQRAQKIDVTIGGDQFYKLKVGTQLIDVTVAAGVVTVKDAGVKGVTGVITDVTKEGKITGTYSVNAGADQTITDKTEFKFFYVDYDVTFNKATKEETWTAKTLKLAGSSTGVKLATDVYKDVKSAIAAAKAADNKTIDAKVAAIATAYGKDVATYIDGQLWGTTYSPAYSYFATNKTNNKAARIDINKAYLVDDVIVVFTNEVSAINA